MSFAVQMNECKTKLESYGHEVLVPLDTDMHIASPNLKDSAAEAAHAVELDAYRDHYNKIEASDAVLILNLPKKGKSQYIGNATTIEIGVAYFLRKKIYVYKAMSPTENMTEELEAFRATWVNEDLGKIK